MKWIKELFSKNTEVKKINASVFIPVDEEHIEDVFQQIYDIEKFYKWFNFFPVLWLSFDKKYMDVGCIGTIRFTMPFFYYKLKVVEVIPNKCIRLEGAGGMVSGKAFFNFIIKEDGILLENPHYLVGINKLLHKYYCYCLTPNHPPFMNWRYSILKKNLFNEIEKKKGNLQK
ncbi:hypothetical protein [Clostridium sp. DJ247]|uniref:hypothetical protein n=1 Tax=Clostridium sp. DJ247 TaxID=2726188 RepID=UPI00162A2F01|nr:hypothetical protein [Clostridium sp. DJ247]MBC2581422.1 hypothetical protein [Clostridium sp. DJ247]